MANDQTTENLFRELNTQYQNLCTNRKDTFLDGIEMSTNSTNQKIFKFKLTLLPHQYFIMPASYREYLSPLTHNPRIYKIYENDEIR